MPKSNPIPQAYGCRAVTIVRNGDYYRLQISGKIFSDRRRRYIPLAANCDSEGLRYAQAKQIELQDSIDRHELDPSLQAYKSWKLIAGTNLQPYTVGQCDRLTLSKLWNDWCEYKKPLVSASTTKIKLRGTYQNALIKFGINQYVDNSLAIKLRNYLINNINLQDTQNLLRELDNACKRLLNIGDSNLTHNPFLDMSKTIKYSRAINSKKIEQRSADLIIDDELGSISFSDKDKLTIINYFKDYVPHYYHFVYFRFYTGMRLGESIELRWKDISSDFSKIVISRAFDESTKTIKNTKTGKTRIFNCPDYLIEFLYEYYLSKNEIDRARSQLVFTSKNKIRINQRSFRKTWNKTLSKLIEIKLISKKLAPKNTRHTFVTAARSAGYSSEEVARQVGHSTKIEDLNYLDRSIDNPLELK